MKFVFSILPARLAALAALILLPAPAQAAPDFPFPPSGDAAVGTLTPASAENGWGPFEVNQSNGEFGVRDGHPLSVGGVKADRGLGVHAPSTLSYVLGGSCSTFTAQVGVDDEVGKRGSVVFTVVGDGKTLYTSPALKGGDAPATVNVSVSGLSTLRLSAASTAGKNYAHADWLNPLLKCTEWSGPTVISKGGTYSGNWETSDPNRPAVDIQTSEPVTLQNSRIRGVGNHAGLVVGENVRLTVRNTVFTGLHTGRAGSPAPHAINLGKPYSLDVQHNLFEDNAGIYVNHFQGDTARGETIKILYNRSVNIDGRLSDGRGGFQRGEGQRQIANFVLLNSVRAPGAEIAWNESVNAPYASLSEDVINMYVSAGTAQAPILIHDNYIQGAYGNDPLSTQHYYGGGILLGDGPNSNPEQSGHLRVYNNQVVGTLNYAIGIVGGVDIQVYDNVALGSGFLPDGRVAGYANTGAQIWNYYKAPAAAFRDNRLQHNVIGWTVRKPDGAVAYTNPVQGYDCGPGKGAVCDGNTDPGTVTLAMEQAEAARWQDKLNKAGLTVGPQN